MKLQPIAFELDAVTSIHRCAASQFPWGVAPEFWYIVRPMFSMDATQLGMAREQVDELQASGFIVAYWTGAKWSHHSPKKFATPEKAMAEWERMTSAWSK